MLTRNIEPVKDNKNITIVQVKLKTGSLKKFFILVFFFRLEFELVLVVSSKGTKDSEYLGGTISCYAVIMDDFP